MAGLWDLWLFDWFTWVVPGLLDVVVVTVWWDLWFTTWVPGLFGEPDVDTVICWREVPRFCAGFEGVPEVDIVAFCDLVFTTWVPGLFGEVEDVTVFWERVVTTWVPGLFGVVEVLPDFWVLFSISFLKILLTNLDNQSNIFILYYFIINKFLNKRKNMKSPVAQWKRIRLLIWGFWVRVPAGLFFFF